MVVYLDASAIVKLVIKEAESNALRRFLRARPVPVSSALSRVEVLRAVRRQSDEATAHARDLLGRIQLIRVDDEILAAASLLAPHALRSLDAIHLASAAALGVDLEGVLTYDASMSEAARLLGLVTFSPG